MRDSKRFPRLATVACFSLIASVSFAATGRNRIAACLSELPFAESSRVKCEFQTPHRKSSGARKHKTTSSNSNNTSASGNQAQGTTPQQSAPPKVAGPLSQVSYELPIRKPLAGEEQVRGLLLRVDCDAKGATFSVQVGERAFKFHTTNFNGVKYNTYTPEVSGEITCGVRNPANNVVVTYRPAKNARAKFDGEPVAVEFVPKDFELKK